MREGAKDPPHDPGCLSQRNGGVAAVAEPLPVDERVERLAAGLANDFNNVLMTILGNAEVALASPLSDPALRERLDEIVWAAQRGASLTRQMLAAIRGAAVEHGPLDLSHLLEDNRERLAAALPAGTSVECRTVADLPLVEADPAGVVAGLVTLLEGVVRRLGAVNGAVVLGTGSAVCEREDLERSYVDGDPVTGRYAYVEVLFPGWAVLPAAGHDPVAGFGAPDDDPAFAPLLAVARFLRGAVTVRSSPAGGLSVRLLLPARPVPGGSGRAAVAERSNGLVLLVDDDSQVREVAEKMLKMQGFQVLTARDGREGVELFRAHARDIVLVVLDLVMPLMDGEAAFREMRRIRGDARIILSTGYDEAHARERLAGEGLAGFIQKPYRLAALREAVRRAQLDH